MRATLRAGDTDEVDMTVEQPEESGADPDLAERRDEHLDVEVTIGVQWPERVDLDKVKTSLPVGNVTVKAVKGGLDVPDPETNDPAVIASAAIAVRIETA